jgi:phosphate transport system substrate-binding protein
MRNRLSPHLFVAAVLMGAVMLLSCSNSQNTNGKKGKTASVKKLVLTGSSTVAPLAAEIAKRFESLNPGTRVDVQAGGSSRGVRDARSGLADIGMVSRDLKKNERDLLNFTIARDGVSIIVNSKNPVTALNDGQIVEIYTDRINNWKDVGGSNAPLTVVNKAEGHSTLELFLKHFHLKNSDVKADVIIGGNEQGIKTVAGNLNAVGYVSIGTAEYDASHGVSIKLLPVGGVKASIESVRNGSFPLARPLNLVTKTRPEGLVKQFIDFATSSKVNDIINEQYFVPIKR